MITFIEDFKAFFKRFLADQQAKLTKLPVFKKGLAFYESQFNFNIATILQELDEDITSAKEFKTGN